jgi:uncharacterized protein (DUF697 family)
MSSRLARYWRNCTAGAELFAPNGSEVTADCSSVLAGQLSQAETAAFYTLIASEAGAAVAATSTMPIDVVVGLGTEAAAG